MQKTLPSDDRILKISEIVSKCRKSRTSIYDCVNAGDFPRPLKIGKRSSGWLESEINTWLAECADARQHKEMHR